MMRDDENDPVPRECTGRCARSGGCEHVVLARRLDTPALGLLLRLPLLDRPAAVTENRAVRITQMSPYAPPTVAGTALRLTRGRVNLRVNPAAATGAFLTEADAERNAPAALRLHSANGAPAHRCHPLVDSDWLLLEGLAREDSAWAEVCAPPLTPAVPADPDDGIDQVGRLDALLTQAHAPSVPHRHIARTVLPQLCEFLCDSGMPVGFAVLTPVAVHAIQDTLDAVSAHAGQLLLATDDATIEIDLRRVAHVLLVSSLAAHGPTAALELYDETSAPVAVLTQFGLVGAAVHDRWEDIAASLPDAVD